MYPVFRTVGVFDSPQCSDILVSEIPSLRTLGFHKTPKFGQRRLRRFSWGSPRLSDNRFIDTLSIGQQVSWTLIFGQRVCLQFSCVLQWGQRIGGIHMAMARKEFTEEEIAILRTSPHDVLPWSGWAYDRDCELCGWFALNQRTTQTWFNVIQ